VAKARAAEEARRAEAERSAEAARQAEDAQRAEEARRQQAARQAEVEQREKAVRQEALPARKSRISRPLVAVGIVLAAVGIAAIVLTHAGIRLGSSSPSTGHTRNVKPAASAALPAPAPARSWRFPTMAGTADQTIVAFNNPGTAKAVVAVNASGTKQQVTLQPQSEAEMELGPAARTGSIDITSNTPIIAERIVVKNGKTSTSYGVHT
jgi:hypothetical protein